VAVLYVAVVLMSVSFCRARGVLLFTLGCMALTLTSYALSSGADLRINALANCILSLAAIGVAAVLALKNQSAALALDEARAGLAHVTRVTALGELTTSIAHEVNQPLTGIVSSGDACLRWLAHEPPNLDEVRKAVGNIISDGTRASEVIGRVRALAQRGRSQRSRLNINEPILEVVALMRRELHENRIDLKPRLAGDLPLILGDRVQLQQVVLNLIINAIEAMNGTPHGPRELSVCSERDESKGVLISVIDSGPEFDPKNAARIFDAFYTSKPDGMGMGLAISRTIIEAHGGRLWVKPNAPRGAMFQFRLPG
jgi:signal transduction histidine kinase